MKLINIQISLGISCSKDFNKEFNLIANYVTKWFLIKIGVVNTNFTRKFVIQLLDENDGILKSDLLLIQGDKREPVSVLKREFNVRKFRESTLDERILFLSEITNDSLNYLFNNSGLPSLNDVLSDINELVKRKLVPLTKEIENKKRRISSQLVVKFDLPLSEVYLSVFDLSTKNNKQIYVGEIAYLPYILEQIFFKIKWLSNEIVQIGNKSGEFLISINIDTSKVSVNINAKDRDRDDVVDEMKFLIGDEALSKMAPGVV
ncbi:hypothetical protein NF867_01840 [Solitalea sp. MAHUQ-68]|uniref:Uncharacterized protein n=1 Tax=Solitalea agri TaxID=2953739 RepID=A0A9X2F012_9SPHI|nr:hypothetical protein [Solitalea agri]MCO4291605.1 hypothetical protein [Solitalea agri]